MPLGATGQVSDRFLTPTDAPRHLPGPLAAHQTGQRRPATRRVTGRVSSGRDVTGAELRPCGACSGLAGGHLGPVRDSRPRHINLSRKIYTLVP